jgi:hypothetical protein
LAEGGAKWCEFDRVDEGIDVGDAPVAHGEDGDRHDTAVAQRYDPGVAAGGEREQGGRRSRPEELQHPCGNGSAAGDSPEADPAADVGLAGDLRVEDRQEAVEEPLGDPTLFGRLDGEPGSAPVGCDRARARLASWRQAAGVRPTISLIASKGYWKTSCRMRPCARPG